MLNHVVVSNIEGVASDNSQYLRSWEWRELRLWSPRPWVEMSRDNIIVKFLNYQEDWEEDKIRTKNRAHESLLNDKYQHVYLYDSDTQETRRILHVEWSTAHRPAKYAVVTQFVHGIHENEEDDLVSYYINESLFDCIRAAPLPYNQQRRLIERPN